MRHSPPTNRAHMAPSPCHIQALLTAAGDGSLGRAQTPLHGVLWRGGNLSSFVLEDQRVQSPHEAHPGFPACAPSLPGAVRALGSRGERSGPAGQHGGALPTTAAREPQHQRERPSRGPASPPTPGAAGLLSGDSTFSHPSPKGLQSSPAKFHTAAAPGRDLGTRGEQGGRPALTAAATSCGPQHPSSSTRQPAARFKLLRRGSMPPAQELRGRPCGAGIARRGSAAPSGSSHQPPRHQRPPLYRTLPLLPAQVRPGLQYSSAQGAVGVGGVGHAAAATAPLLSEEATTLHPSLRRRGFVGSKSGRRLSPPRTSTGRAAGPPDYFLQRKSLGWVGAGAVVASARSPLWRGGWRAWGSPGSASAYPAPLRCDASGDSANFLPGHAVSAWRGCGASPTPSGQRRQFQPGSIPALGAPWCRGKEPALRAHRALPAPSDGGPSSSSGCAVPPRAARPWDGRGECRAGRALPAVPSAPP